jgi:site-specific recombinase XerD
MTMLQNALADYLALRRALGYKLVEDGRVLEKFVAFVEQAGSTHITTELALHWATQSSKASHAHQAHQLSRVRLFAEYLSGIDSQTEIPPRGLLSTHYQRQAPYIYSECQIRDLVTAAGQLPSATGLRACTYATLFGLLAVTGLRIGEAIALDYDDVDLGERVLLVRQSKFAKDRLVPIHSSTASVLGDYMATRTRCHPHQSSHAFFLAERGTRLTDCMVRQTFIRLSRNIGLRASGDHHGPRLHDLRHTFAVTTVQRWYQDGLDVDEQMPLLATFLGHSHVSDSYWYLSAVPQLMDLAGVRLELNLGEPSL